MNRNNTIYKLRNKKQTLKAIGASFDITQERVRQILIEKDQEKCIKHDASYIGFCEYCKEEKLFTEKLNTSSFDSILEESSHYIKEDRTKMTVLKRTLIAKILRDKFNLTYPKIGIILKRDHSTVIKMCKK